MRRYLVSPERVFLASGIELVPRVATFLCILLFFALATGWWHPILGLGFAARARWWRVTPLATAAAGLLGFTIYVRQVPSVWIFAVSVALAFASLRFGPRFVTTAAHGRGEYTRDAAFGPRVLLMALSLAAQLVALAWS